ncbi:MAG: hypothetical protein AAB796_02245 [Patescibacteria group bacterium]
MNEDKKSPGIFYASVVLNIIFLGILVFIFFVYRVQLIPKSLSPNSPALFVVPESAFNKLSTDQAAEQAGTAGQPPAVVPSADHFLSGRITKIAQDAITIELKNSNPKKTAVLTLEDATRYLKVPPLEAVKGQTVVPTEITKKDLKVGDDISVNFSAPIDLNTLKNLKPSIVVLISPTQTPTK